MTVKRYLTTYILSVLLQWWSLLQFHFFPCLGQCLPIFTYFLGFEVLEILLLPAGHKNGVRKRAPVPPVLQDQTLQLASVIVYFTLTPH